MLLGIIQGKMPLFFDKNQVLFTLKLKAKKQGFLSEAFSYAKSGLSPEVYLSDLTSLKLEKAVISNPINDFETYSPKPNPFITETIIPFSLDASTYGILQVFDMSGKLIFKERKLMSSGNDYWIISAVSFSHSGLYFYEIVTDSGHKSAGKIWLLQK